MHRITKNNIVTLFIIIFCIMWIIKSRWIPEVKMTISKGVVATVNNVQKNDNKWSIEISLKKEDGTAFDENVEVGSVALSSLEKERLSWKYDKELSDDQKVINYLFTGQSATPAKGVEIELDSLIVATQGEHIIEESIYDIYHTYPLQYDYDEEIARYMEQEEYEESIDEGTITTGKGEGLVPISDIENFSIIGAGFSENYDAGRVEGQARQEVLHIRTSLRAKPVGVSNEAKIMGLYNELTGEKVSWFQGYTRPYITGIDKEQEHREDIEIQENYYGLTNTEKLQYIKPIVNYTIKKVINEGKWVLNVRF